MQWTTIRATTMAQVLQVKHACFLLITDDKEAIGTASWSLASIAKSFYGLLELTTSMTSLRTVN